MKYFRSLRATHLLALPLVLIGLCLFPATVAQANDCSVNRYFVDQDATGSNDGASWANANTSLQTALTATVGCANVTQIWVAEGLYKPGTLADDTFTIRPGLAVYGGFAGTESALNQRNWVTNVTVLSGDIGSNDTVDANGVVTTTTNIVSPNSYHVVTMDGTGTPITVNTQLDGFVVTAGYAHTGFTDRNGGGLHCDGQGAGKECSPTITNVTFSGNSAEELGGAMGNLAYTSGKSNPVLNNVTFRGNMASGGGAMANLGIGGTSSPLLTDVTFIDNQAISAAGAMWNDGSNSGTSSPVLNRVAFTNNSFTTSFGSGGAIFNNGQFMGNSSPKLTDVTFTSNSARDGGAMTNDCSSMGTLAPILNRVTFNGNIATRNGGAMYTVAGGFGTTCSPALLNVVFLNNTSASGGAMHNTGFANEFLPVLLNVTFAGSTGTAMYNNIDAIVNPTFPISNTIFYGNDSQLFNLGSVVPSFGNTLVQGSGGSGGGWNSGFGVDGGGNLDANPRYVDGASGDLRLRSDSPAIDVGDNNAVPVTITVDILGAPRITDGNNSGPTTVDMGAYEFGSFPVTVVLSGNGTGTVSSALGGITCGGDCTESYESGNTVSLTATPDSSSNFTGWSGACGGLDGCTIDVLGANQATATFTLKQYTVAVSADPGAGGIATGGGTVNHGDTVPVTATANLGYTFINWTEGGSEVSTDPTYSFTSTGNRTLVANFALSQYTINLSTDPGAGGSVGGGGTVTHGDNVVATATANTGYSFVNWTEAGGEVSTNPNFSFTATGNRTLVANFVLKQYAVVVSGEPTAGGIATGGGTVTHGDTVPVTATASTNYTFVNWAEGGSEVSTDPTYSFTATGNRTLVANFALNQYAITLSADPVAGGTLGGGGTVSHGDTVPVTATANPGYTFVNWTEGDSEVSPTPNFSFTATGDRTFVAHFSATPYTITVSVGSAAGGTVTGGGIVSFGSTTTVTATANSGLIFVNWTDGDTVVSTNPIYSFTVAGDRTLVANFANGIFLPQVQRP